MTSWRVTSGNVRARLARGVLFSRRYAVSDHRSKLHATIDDITTDVARLKAVQARKRDMRPGDPRGTALANEAVDIASQLVPKTVAERELVNDLAGD
jgi:hypothetical protein